jgi:hypothetical protein
MAFPEGALPGGDNLAHPLAPLQQPSSMDEFYMMQNTASNLQE